MRASGRGWVSQVEEPGTPYGGIPRGQGAPAGYSGFCRGKGNHRIRRRRKSPSPMTLIITVTVGSGTTAMEVRF
jgi:hypothetical protein